jgi:hypothetical protein
MNLNDIIFHVYAINWNEERLLPNLFKYYHQADKIFILDNMSDDFSHQIINKNNGIIIPFDTNGKFDDFTNQNIKNNIWKQSKGIADFVIVQDLDEFLFFPEYPNDIKSALKYLKNKDITIIISKGYNMYCTDDFYDNILNDQLISASIMNGSRNPQECDYDKPNCFNPNEIEEINYTPGSHQIIDPKGKINIEHYGIILHYKYIGKNYLFKRYPQLSDRLSSTNIEYKMGIQYLNYSPSDIDTYYQLYSNEDIFRIMYPNLNINKIEFNGRCCLVYLTSHLNNNTKFYEYLKENINGNIYVDISNDILSICYSKLSGASQIFCFEEIDIQNTILLNGWKNVIICDIDMILQEIQTIKNKKIIIKIKEQYLNIINSIPNNYCIIIE